MRLVLNSYEVVGMLIALLLFRLFHDLNLVKKANLSGELGFFKEDCPSVFYL